MESLKREFLELLDRDLEFRYAVAGYLGLSEILKRLDALAEEQIKLREEQTKIWSEIEKIYSEIKMLREEQTRLAEEQARLREDMNAGFKRHDEELIRLREDMVTGFRRHDEEIAKLREDMVAGFKRYDEELIRLREDMVTGFKRHDEILERHAQEIMRLREDMNAGFKRYDEELIRLREDMVTGFRRHDEEIAKLREDMVAGFRRHDEEFTRIWEEIRALRMSQDRLWRYVRDGFRDLRRAIGIAFEDYARSFIEFHLDEMGYPEASVEKKILIHEGKLLEINIFCEEPLVVGETTLTIRDTVEAEREIEKILERTKIIEEIFKKKPILTVLAVSHTPPNIAEILKRLAEKHNIKLILRKEIEEHL